MGILVIGTDKLLILQYVQSSPKLRRNSTKLQSPKEQIHIMGTSAGPSLQGIGRGGDSNLVLEMDAHDAKSYPGEPTDKFTNNFFKPGQMVFQLGGDWTVLTKLE